MAVQPKSKYRYHYDEMKEPFDLAVRDAGIHIWHGSLHKEILFDAATADKKIYWFEIPTYMLTSKIAASIKKSGFIFSDVKNFLRELKKLDAAGEIIFGRPYVCMFTAEDGGQAGYCRALQSYSAKLVSPSMRGWLGPVMFICSLRSLTGSFFFIAYFNTCDIPHA